MPAVAAAARRKARRSWRKRRRSKSQLTLIRSRRAQPRRRSKPSSWAARGPTSATCVYAVGCAGRPVHRACCLSDLLLQLGSVLPTNHFPALLRRRPPAQVCGQHGHTAGFIGAKYIDCPNKPCYLCGQQGHSTMTCPFRIDSSHGCAKAAEVGWGWLFLGGGSGVPSWAVMLLFTTPPRSMIRLPARLLKQ